MATEATDPTDPDGVVLSSTILTDNQERPVPDMPLDRLASRFWCCTMNWMDAASARSATCPA
ncbi:MAG TPA: hypothetical protein VIN38_04255 [Thiobacillus sp.]